MYTQYYAKQIIFVYLKTYHFQLHRWHAFVYCCISGGHSLDISISADLKLFLCIFPAMCESAWAVAHIMWNQVVCCCWRGRVYCHAALSAVLNLRSTVNDKVRACIGDLYIKHSYKSVPCELSDCSVKMCLCTF